MLRPYAAINPSALGLIDVGVFVTLSGDTPSVRKKILSDLTQSEVVPCVNELIGPFQLFFSVVGRSLAEVSKNLDKIIHQSSASIVRRAIAPRVNWYTFGQKFLAPHVVQSSYIALGGEIARVELDEIDIKVVKALIELKEFGLRPIAQRTGLPEATVSYRINRLRERGVLVGICAETSIEPSRYGVEHYTMFIKQRGADPAFGKRMFEFCRIHPNIVHLVECLGEWSYEICCESDDLSLMNRLHHQLYEQFGSLIGESFMVQLLRNEKLQPLPGIW